MVMKGDSQIKGIPQGGASSWAAGATKGSDFREEPDWTALSQKPPTVVHSFSTYQKNKRGGRRRGRGAPGTDEEERQETVD